MDGSHQEDSLSITRAVLALAAVPAIALVAVPATATGAVAAPHTAKPAATFSFAHNRVDQKTQLHFTYSTKHLPRGSAIYLQWQVGTAHAWRNVERLRKASGTATARGVSIGKWEYRIDVVRRGKTVVASRERPLYAYGTVAYARLCSVWQGSSCPAYDVQIGNTDFTSYYSVWNLSYPDFATILQYHSTSCRSLDIQYADSDTENSADQEYIQLVQSRSPLQAGQGPVETVNTFTATLDGGPFMLQASEDNSNFNVWINGSASCYTSSGKP
jgi:hypothetical protein